VASHHLLAVGGHCHRNKHHAKGQLAIQNRRRPRQAEETVPSVRVTRATRPPTEAACRLIVPAAVGAGGAGLAGFQHPINRPRPILRAFAIFEAPRAPAPSLIEHEVVTLLGQRVFGIAHGYEDLNDHDELRHDPMMGVLAGKLEARREECAPVAGRRP
jgi:hypothetical protein